MLFRRPVHEVATWPAAEMDLIESFLAREPAPDQRVEIAVARMCELFANAWCRSDGPRVSVMDFLPFLDAWKPSLLTDPRYSEADREVLRVLGKNS